MVVRNNVGSFSAVPKTGKVAKNASMQQQKYAEGATSYINIERKLVEMLGRGGSTV